MSAMLVLSSVHDLLVILHISHFTAVSMFGHGSIFTSIETYRLHNKSSVSVIWHLSLISYFLRIRLSFVNESFTMHNLLFISKSEFSSNVTVVRPQNVTFPKT